jgi:hypothetical protein
MLVTMPVSPPAGLAPIGAAEGAHEDSEHDAAEAMIVGEPVTEPVRNREHPLADRDVGGEHPVDEV